MTDYHARPTEISFKYRYKKGHVETEQKKINSGWRVTGESVMEEPSGYWGAEKWPLL